MARTTHNKSSQRSPFEGQLPNHAPLFEACEKRLVLSAQLLFDVLSDQALELHGSQTGLESPLANSDSIAVDTHLQEAHAATGLDVARQQFGLTGAGQTVAVIDSGIAWDHVALGQGYGPGYRVVGGWDFTEENDSQPYDDGPAGFHGTHVSGIIASDDPQHMGVAPDVDLVALRVFNDAGQGQLSWVENALRWVHENRNSFENPITTVNLSIGTQWNGNEIPQWATLEEELQLLYNDGIVVTASAGNSFQSYHETGLSYPAASSYVLPIASVDDDGQLSSFSQRSDRVLAAPGSNIVSTIPDHVMGRDGKIDDFSPASGTSMASPYVAGASVLVRQAMEMTGWESITASTIAEHLRTTADSVFDADTGLNYDVLNLQHAIDSIIPDDVVGNTVNSAAGLDLGQTSLSTWINYLGDTDVYRWVASSSGALTIDASTDWLEGLSWTVQTSGQTVGSGGLDPASINLVAGQTYELVVSSNATIGPADFDLAFAATGSNQGGEQSSGGSQLSLGDIRYFEESVDAGSGYSVTATQSGTFTIQWTNPDAASGSLVVQNGSGAAHTDSSWENGTLRLDVQVQAGEQLNLFLPGSSSDQGELALANVLQQHGTSVTVNGTLQADQLRLDLSHGTSIGFGAVDYDFTPGQVSHLTLNGYGSNDQLSVVGSQQIDQVDLRPTGSTIQNNDIQMVIGSIEEVDYASGGGADRVYLYDSDSDDTLTARPGSAELVGVGYRFEVEGVSRIFIHATGGGQDFAYLYDSEGSDRLSVRPQFTSLSGDGFFNYVRGFERVYAYASAGNIDTANLYDSEFNDRFNTNGVSASIVGPGFSSFTRSFEQVNAFSTAGGNDLATLYGADSQTQWQQGSDFVSFRESNWQREARGFEQIATYVASQPFSVGSNSIDGLASDSTIPQVAADGPAYNQPPTEIANGLMGPQIESYASMDHDSAPAPVPWLRDIDAQIDSGIVDIEDGILRETQSMRDLLATKLHLPEERIIDDQQLEQDVLDEAFRQFDQLFSD